MGLAGLRFAAPGLGAPAASSKLSDVNTTDIKAATSLGCRTMQNVFNADDNDVPFFATWIVPRRRSEKTRFEFNAAVTEAHVPACGSLKGSQL